MPTIPQRTPAPRRNDGQHSASVAAETPLASLPALGPTSTVWRTAASPTVPARAHSPLMITIATVNGMAPRSRPVTPTSPSPTIKHDIADLPPEELARFLAELNLVYVSYDYTSHWSPLRMSSANFVDNSSPRHPPRVYDTEDALFHTFHRNLVFNTATTSAAPVVPLPANPATLTAPLPSAPPTVPPPATPTVPPPATPIAPPPATPAASLPSLTVVYYEDGAPAVLRAWRKQNRKDLLYVVAKGRYIGVFDSWFVVRDQVSGFSGNSYRSFPDWQSAWERWCEVNLQGRTSGPLHRLSMVGVVRSRTVEGAPPPYIENA